MGRRGARRPENPGDLRAPRAGRTASCSRGAGSAGRVCIAPRARTRPVPSRHVSPAPAPRRLGRRGARCPDSSPSPPAAARATRRPRIPPRSSPHARPRTWRRPSPPQGATRDDALAAARKVLGTDRPRGRLRELSVRRAARATSSPGSAIASARSPCPCGSTRRRRATSPRPPTPTPRATGSPTRARRTQRYEDVELRLAAGGNAYALVEDHVVVGTPAAVTRGDRRRRGRRRSPSRSASRRRSTASTATTASAAATSRPRAARGPAAPSLRGGMFGSLATGARDGIAADGGRRAVPRRRLGACAPTSRASAAPIPASRPTRPSSPDVTGDAWLAVGLGEVGARLKERGSAPRRPMLGLLGAQAGLDIDKDLARLDGRGRGLRDRRVRRARSAARSSCSRRTRPPRARRSRSSRRSSAASRAASSDPPLRAAGVDEGVTMPRAGRPRAGRRRRRRRPVRHRGGRRRAARGDLPQLAARRRPRLPSGRRDARRRPEADDVHRRGAQATALARCVAGRTGASVREVREALGGSPPLVAADRGERRWRASIGLRST